MVAQDLEVRVEQRCEAGFRQLLELLDWLECRIDALQLRSGDEDVRSVHLY